MWCRRFDFRVFILKAKRRTFFFPLIFFLCFSPLGDGPRVMPGVSLSRLLLLTKYTEMSGYAPWCTGAIYSRASPTPRATANMPDFSPWAWRSLVLPTQIAVPVLVYFLPRKDLSGSVNYVLAESESTAPNPVCESFPPPHIASSGMLPVLPSPKMRCAGV